MGNHICPWWLAYTFDNPLRRFFHNPERILGEYVDEGMTVLDVGCGMGFFSLGLAKLVGDKGCVIAADVQPEMLNTLEKRADKEGLSKRVRLHRSELNEVGVTATVDFILAFWMVHEVPDTDVFFRQICSCLKPKGRVLIAEPKFHVSLKRFQEIMESAQNSGLNVRETPSLRFSRSAVFEKDSFPDFSKEGIR